MRTLLVVLFLCLGLSGVVVDGVHIEEIFDDTEDITYGVIIDCGSSGTRAHIFKWNSSLSHAELLHQIEPLREANGNPVSSKLERSLSSFRAEPEGASEYMKPLINFILSKVSDEQSTGIYIMGTAGMRLLDTESRDSIIRDISQDLEDNYNFAKVDTSVISGPMEGVYQWISVNSKAKLLNTSETYAIIEMGGASIQLTYQLKPDVYEQVSSALMDVQPDALVTYERSIITPQLSRESEEYNYQLVSLTWLGFGSNSAREAYVDLLVGDHVRHNPSVERQLNLDHITEPLNIINPCLPVGAVDVMLKPMRLLSSFKQQTVGIVVEHYGEPMFRVRLLGGGNFNRCRSGLRRMLSRAKKEKLNCSPGEACSMSLIGTPFVPHEAFHFLGLSDFFYSMKTMLNLGGVYNRAKALEKTKEVCNLDFETLKYRYPEVRDVDTKSSRVMHECFKAVWMDVFLKDALGMPEDNKNFETVGNINGQGVDWTLGAVMDKSLAIEQASDEMRAPAKFLDDLANWGFM